jgi:hypothetical protein
LLLPALALLLSLALLLAQQNKPALLLRPWPPLSHRSWKVAAAAPRVGQ